MAFTTPPSKFADKGKWAEEKVQKWLDEQSKVSAKFAFHRMPDARAARGALSPQPADWIVSKHLTGGTFTTWLEAKETAESNRLPKAKIRQYGKLLMFHHAGMQARVIVFRSLYSDWVYFDNVDLFLDPSKSSFSFKDKQSFSTWDKALTEIFE